MTATGATVTAVEGAPFSGVLASFTDADPNATTANFSATIQWGDGTSSAATVSANGTGGFNVSGQHTYTMARSYNVSVSVADVGGATATAASTATVADAALTATGATVTAVEGAPFSGVLASFTDADPNATAANFSATIQWGDGTSSTATVSANGSGI